MPQRVVHPVVEDEAEHAHSRQREHEGKPIRQADADQEGDHHVGAEHGEIALCEVHHVGGADDEHEAQCHQRIDAAEREALEQHL